jgi:hypothetical protein
MRLLHGIVLSLLATVGSAAGTEPAIRLQVEAPAELAGIARKIEALATQQHLFTAALQLTGVERLQQPVKVVLVAEQDRLAREVPSWVSGFAVAARGVIVLFPARVRSYPDRNLQVLLQHEVAHLLVARAAGMRPVPRWFNEGIATVAAREWGFEDRARYSMAVIGSGPRSIAELDSGFHGSKKDAARSYALSAAMVRFLRARYGADVTPSILELLATGTVFNEAFHQVTGTPLSRAEEIFFHDEAFWSTWVPFLTSSGLLWMTITLLALVAIKRRRDRNRALHEKWDQEDQALMRQALVIDEEEDGWVN